MKSSIGRLALLSAAVLGLAACESSKCSTSGSIFTDKGTVNGAPVDSVVCSWARGATVAICTRYVAGAPARKDTSGLGQ
jgi:hypothetical protein